MCGIAGFSFKKSNPKLSKRFLEIKNYISHRGPDNSGSFVSKNLTLIHTRLSIVDLESGNQPIENEKYVLVANGEIYNDLDIRKVNKSYKFLTNSDSESILALYDKYGVNGFSRLRGMFAFVIFDKKRNEVILARDEFGIKPLYFSLEDEGIIFCSELNPIKLIRNKKSKINNFKVNEVMQLQYCSGTETIFKGINRIAPGQTLVIKDGKITSSITNSLPEKKKNNFKRVSLNELINESVKSHLRSDVPYCLFFSGGIDSMLLLYHMNLLRKKNMTAYSVSFDDGLDCNLNEITKNFNVDHIKINFSENDFWDWIPFAAKKIDEPIADYAILPTFKLASIASKKFKVAITGEGGDELFGGYGRYKKTQRILFKKKSYYPKGAFEDLLKHKFNYWSQDLEKNDYKIKYFGNTFLQKMQYFDYNNWMPNNLLVKLDRCLMAFGMEGRTPFIDKKLFKDLFYIDDKEKISRGFGKYYIRDYLKKKVTFYNAFEKKIGFTVPIYDWIPNKINDLENLLPKQDFLKNYINEDEQKFIFKCVKKNKKFAKPLWHILFFTAWYLINIKGIEAKGNFFDIISTNA